MEDNSSTITELYLIRNDAIHDKSSLSMSYWYQLLRTTCISVFCCYLHAGVCQLVTSRKSFVNIWSRTTYMVRSQDGMDKVQKYLNTVIQLTIDLLYCDIFIVTIEIYKELSNVHVKPNYEIMLTHVLMSLLPYASVLLRIGFHNHLIRL